MNARFYFANLCADVARCIKALESDDDKRYTDSLLRAHKTLTYLHGANRPEAYEEGLLLLRGLEYTRELGVYEVFREQLNNLALRISVAAL